MDDLSLYLALLAVTLCAGGATECAAHAKEQPRLSSSLMYFALNWAILLPYYALQGQLVQLPDLSDVAEFLPEYSAILLLLTAGPLWSEAKVRQEEVGKTQASHVHWVDRFAQRSLYFVVVPHVVAFARKNYERETVIILHSALFITGVILIAGGLYRLIKNHTSWRFNLWKGFCVFALGYACVDTWWSIQLIRLQVGTPMPAWVTISLAAGKLVFSTLFLILVMLEALRSDERGGKV